MDVDDHAKDIRARMKNDMRTTLHRNGMDIADQTWVNIILDELVDDGMHPVEHLLTKVEFGD